MNKRADSANLGIANRDAGIGGLGLPDAKSIMFVLTAMAVVIVMFKHPPLLPHVRPEVFNLNSNQVYQSDQVAS